MLINVFMKLFSCSQIKHSGILDEQNFFIGRNVKLSCSENEEDITLVGIKCFCDQAFENLQNLVGNFFK